MESKPSYRQGHLIVAAVRILIHRHGRPPTTTEIAQLSDMSEDVVGLLVRSLEGLGIVRTVKSAFETRVEIVDHIGLEELPSDEEASAFGSEVDEFHERYAKKQEDLQRLFSTGEHKKEKQEKLDALDEELKGFKGKKIEDDSGLFKDPEED